MATFHFGWAWAVPFAALLLSIALGPIISHKLWHHHYGKIAAFWSGLFLCPFVFYHGLGHALHEIFHLAINEYLPFLILLSALFSISGGICIRGNFHGSPGLNVSILALGTALSSIIGTTGSAMLFIRPLMRANDNRKHTVHIFVFFIFLVANIGGALSPLGDPPLFLGFLQGVDFFWPLKNLWPHTLFLTGALLLIFYALDYYYFHQREEERPAYFDPSPDSKISINGKFNFLLLLAAIGLVLFSGFWQAEPWIIFGTPIAAQNLMRDLGLLGLAWLSFKLTPRKIRAANQFSWEPMIEVAKLFAGIFITIIPVLAILRAGHQGVFSPLLNLLEQGAGQQAQIYFWLTGFLSAFLDNAPTYLVFFNLAGGQAQTLMHAQAPILTAISAAAVFMGALSYVGNAPNLMVRAIVAQRGIKMPGFFGYLLWSFGILLPLFALLIYCFF